MKLNKKFIIVASIIVLLVALIIVLTVISNNMVKNQQTDELANAETVQILNVANPEKKFKVTNPSGSYSVVFVDNVWYCEENTNAFLNQTYVEALFNTVCTLSAVPIENNAADLAKYGLDNPASFFEFKDEDGNAYVIKFGLALPTKTGFYAMINDKKDVYILSNDVYNLLCGNLSSLRNKDLISVSSDDFCGITIKNSKDTITVQPKITTDANTHSSTSWKMTSPYLRDVNQYVFEQNILNNLNISVYDFVDDNPSDYAVYGLDNPKYEITINKYEGSFTIFLGNEFFAEDGSDNKLIYMQVKGLPNVFSMLSESVSYKDFTAIDLIENLAFSRIIDCVDTISFSAGNTHILKTDKTGFYADGKTVDEEAFRGAYYYLISSIIMGEVTGDFGNEMCRFTFNYNNDTPSENVVFYEYGDLYAAVEINGSTDFYVKRSDVNNMIDSVNKLAN